MKKVCAISLALLLLLAVGIEGLVTVRRDSCKCRTMSSKSISLRFVTNFEVFPVGPSCNKLEYIVTMKRSGNQECLDPTSEEVRTMYKKWKKTQSRRRMPIRPQ